MADSTKDGTKASEDNTHPDAEPSVPAGAHAERRVVEELARVFSDEAEATMIVTNAGYPRQRLPLFRAPDVFWHRVVEAVRDGTPPGTLSKLLHEALRQRPDNHVFKGILMETAERARSDVSFDLKEARASASQQLDASPYEDHNISREELTSLIADARVHAEESAINIGGDLSWLEEELPALMAVTQQRPELLVRIYYDRTRVRRAFEPVLRRAIACGIQLRPYPADISSRLRCMLLDHQSRDGRRVIVFSRSGQPGATIPRSEHRFVWHEFAPHDVTVTEATCAFVASLEATHDEPIRVGIMGVNNVGKTSLAVELSKTLEPRYDVELVQDAFRGPGAGTGLEHNAAMLYSQLDREARVPIARDIVLIDRTLADNLCFAKMRGFSSLYSKLSPIVAEQTQRLDLIVDVRRKFDDYPEDTQHVVSDDRAKVRSLLDKFLRDHQVQVRPVRINPSRFEESLATAVAEINESIVDILLRRLYST